MLIQKLLEGITGTPKFDRFRYKDFNPLADTTKYRMIGAPNADMRVIHARLIKNLRSLPVDHQFSVGARPGGNPIRNVRRHRHTAVIREFPAYVSNRHFYLVDLTDAYGHVDAHRLAEILHSFSEWSERSVEEIEAFLKTYCFAPATDEEVEEARQQELWPIRRGRIGLVQGGPASPDLFNLYAAIDLDAKLAPLCAKYQLVYSRYLDDLTFSSRYDRIGKRKRVELLRVIRAAGFHINTRKSQVIDVWRGPVVINGVAMDRTGRLYLPRWYLRKLRGMLHMAMQTGEPPPVKAHGHMGVFLGTLPRVRNMGYAPRNQTERDLIERYRAYQKKHRRPRTLKSASRLPKLPRKPREVDLDHWF